MEEVIKELNLEDRTVRYVINDRYYHLQVIDISTGNILPESLSVSSEYPDELTHIPKQQVNQAPQIILYGIAGLALTAGIVGATITAQKVSGVASWIPFGLGLMTSLGALYWADTLYDPSVLEFNQLLSKYNLPTLAYKKEEKY